MLPSRHEDAELELINPAAWRQLMLLKRAGLFPWDVQDTAIGKGLVSTYVNQADGANNLDAVVVLSKWTAENRRGRHVHD